MAFDYKKEYKEFYMPKNKPSIVTVPGMNYIAVRGHGDPNAEDGEYKQSIGLLYSIAFTIKMSKKGDHQIDGYFDYVVPPLEGFWWQYGVEGIDYAHKENFEWISVIRLPDFVTKVDFDWAIEEATKKKKTDFLVFVASFDDAFFRCPLVNKSACGFKVLPADDCLVMILDHVLCLLAVVVVPDKA